MKKIKKDHFIVLQPYGAAFVNGDSGKIEILNETAAIILENAIKDKSTREIAKIIAEHYEIDCCEAYEDVESFLSSCPHANKRPCIITGSHDRISIVQADLELTLKCPLSCKYCFAEAGKADLEENSLDDWMMTINWLLDHGLRHATLTGGDPMTSSNFWAVCEKLSLEGVIFQAFTTGLFINSSNVTRFLEYPINFVQISLDSMEPDYHDRYRGKSHKQAVEAVKILSGNGIKTVIGSNIFSDTVEHIEYLAEFAASTNSVLRCNPIDARGRGFGFSSDNAYNGNLRERIEFFSDRLKDRFPQVFMEDVDVGDLGDELHCKFYHGMIAIGSDGRIRPCLESKSFFKKVAPWAIENRKAYDLNSIEDHCAYSIIKEIDERYRPNDDLCSTCDRAPYCYGCLLAGYECHNLKTQERR